MAKSGIYFDIWQIGSCPARYDKDKASALVERPVGQRTSSHGGMYAYRRKGVLDEIPHVRRIRGVVIVRTEDVKRVIAFSEGVGAEVHARTIELAKEDRATLGA